MDGLTAVKKSPVSNILRKLFPKKEEEVKLTRKERRERFKKRLSCLTKEEQQYLKRKMAMETIWPFFRAFIIIGLCFIILYPLIFMLSAAFRPRAEMNDPTILWIPKTFTLSNIQVAVGAMDFWKTLHSTLVLNIGCSIISVAACAVTGYGFARFKFKFRETLFFIVIMMILVLPQILLIPQFMFFRYFDIFGIIEGVRGQPVNFINTFVPMYFPALTANGISAGLFIFLFRQSFRGLPKELEDAAYLDGCSPFMTFLKVMIPNAASTFLTVFLFSVVWYWNDYYVSTSFFTQNRTIALMLKNLDSQIKMEVFGNPGATVNMREIIVWMQAGCLIAITPMLVMYVALQKYFTEGIARSGLTGM